jgi:hypothetical protein
MIPRIAPLAAVAMVLAACAPERPVAPPLVANKVATTTRVATVVDVSRDTTSQNETPLAVNPTNAANLLTGANDWNYNDGCAVNASFDGGKTWTPTLPSGFVPGLTRFTNDPSIPGTGFYEAAGDPGTAFGPDGTAYFVCQAFNFTSPYQIALFVSRSTDGGLTWSAHPVQVSVWNGNGKTKGSNGQFPDHESIVVDNNPASPYRGTIYIAWAQFNGNSHSPVFVSYSRDGARTFSPPTQITASTVRNNQDARIAIAPDGRAFLTFDNGIQGNKGTALYVSTSGDGGASWSAPLQFGGMVNPVCVFPPYCFNLLGGAFRAGGSYPAPAFDAVRGQLDVVYADIVNGRAQIFFTSAAANDLAHWSAPAAIAPTAAGDRFESELSIAPNGRLDASFYDRSYSGNALLDVTYAQSADGGATWATTRVTDAGFDPSQYGVPFGSTIRPFVGDYNGMVSTNDRVGITWTGVGPTFGRLNTNLEIFFASLVP